MEKPRLYTVAEYLAIEEASEERHEYRDGEIVAMAGANENHLRLVRNLSRRLAEKLDGSSCENFGVDLRVRVDGGRYCYPDQVIACAPLIYDPPQTRVMLTNPTVIFEVLSESTESYDRGDKFSRYRTIESLQEYVLISQDKIRVETFYRQPDGVWAIGGMVEELEATLNLRSVPAEVRLADLYAGVQVPESIEPRPPM
jgi:Uma2 family endonuclease